MPTEPKARGGLSLGARIFLATVLLVLIAVGTAVVITTVSGNQIAENAAMAALRRASAVQAKVQDERLEQLWLMAQVISEDPSFVAYVAASLESEDVASLRDQLEERCRSLGCDVAILMHPDGRLAARTDQPIAAAADPAVAKLMPAVDDGEYETVGIWARQGELYYAVTVPVGQLLDAFLSIGLTVNDDSARELEEISDTEVAFVANMAEGPKIAGSTLDLELAEELKTAIAASSLLRGGGDMAESVELAGNRWLAQARPLADPAGQIVGVTVALASVAEQVAPFRRISLILAGIGLLMVLLASFVSYFLPRHVLRPVEQLAVAAKAAVEGDYDQDIPVRRADEVGQLADAFRVLLSDLREKRDMETYINELSRTMPEQAAAPVGDEVAPPEARQGVLLGVELRPKSKDRPPGAESTPEAVLQQYSRDLGVIGSATTEHGGRVSAVVGHRLVAEFSGDRAGSRALAAAAAVLDTGEAWAGAANGRPPALALASGLSVSGSALADGKARPAITGVAVDEVENLLRIAKPGDLLLGRSTFAELAEVFERAGVALHEQPGFSIGLPLYALDPEAAGRITRTESLDQADTTPGLPLPPTGTAPMPHTSARLAAIGPGSVLGDRFEIQSVLGAGGMGVVYKARDRLLQELVALKMLKRKAWGDSENFEQLKSELKLARKIGHANVLRTYDFGEVEGVPFITMEYVRGVTLRYLLDQSGRLPLSAGLRLARQLCRGLEAAHDQGVLHRDIKPENMIVEPAGNAKLMDFGIARPVRKMDAGTTQPGSIVGTPSYLAPEQIQGVEPDVRADIYACGVVFYELFTGSLPFSTQGTIMEILMRKLKDEPVPPRTHWAEMPAALERIILRALERQRDDRYPDVRRVALDLEAIRA